MTVSALALAAALLLWPATPRRTVALRRMDTPGPRRVPVARVVVILGAVLVWLVPVPVALATAVVAGTVAIRRRRRAARRQRQQESAALQAALDVLVGELRTGVHPVTAFGTAAGEVSGPVHAGMSAVAARARLGADVAAGLEDAAAASQLPMHWERLAACWCLAHAYGLSIATLMRTAQRDIVERERFSAHVEAAMAGPRATAAVLAGLPVAGIALGQLIGARPLAFLCGAGVGGWLLVIGVLLACAGLMWSDRITEWALK
ncbi:type II secretion system F family protein [Mycolicibacterium neworleansense]|uniref:Type II secretion system protein F n=1 Tax=Mycolicibacterium neworleansense TaxID=146018 RepID=A0A0H5RV91_9MYCO|nr:type II secretion system F family protein [Mycolicibacterium neworleansense]MCV7360559.1 type II secretion system F family protein [Mycolicibacterium neworleansense]CRZ17823.1 type II secretion system protein F [Mycolicibacterium neworleansense]